MNTTGARVRICKRRIWIHVRKWNRMQWWNSYQIYDVVRETWVMIIASVIWIHNVFLVLNVFHCKWLAKVFSFVQILTFRTTTSPSPDFSGLREQGGMWDIWLRVSPLLSQMIGVTTGVLGEYHRWRTAGWRWRCRRVQMGGTFIRR